MALEDILGAIRGEADDAAARLLEEAESKARQILLQAKGEAAREEARLASTVDARIREERGRILSGGQLDAARERRAAREKVYQSVLDDVSQRLSEVRSSPRYRILLELLLDDTLADLPAPTAIRVDPDDIEIMGELLEARGLGTSLETEDLPLGGVVAVFAGRSVDNTLTGRLRRADPQLRVLASQAVPALRGGGG